ncbi:MAG: amidohydrolase family protein [Planctomycetota bacterium]|nr:amidohydrolase family protein [Planctomycetota bacterium]
MITNWCNAGRGDSNDAQVRDLDDHWILPAFVDSHLHLLYSLEHARQLDLSNLTPESIRSLLTPSDRVGDAATRVVGHGWKDPLGEQLRPDPRRFLDSILPDSAVFLWNSDHHRALVSSVALESAGIEPVGHSGVVTEQDAERVWASLGPPPQPDAAAASRWLLERGITAATTFDRGDSIECLRRENSEGQLGVRLRHGLPECQFLEILESGAGCHPEGGEDSSFAMPWIKIFLDGTLGSRTAWMKSEYDDDPNNFGVVRRTAETLEKTARLAAEHGWALAIHAIGDAAVAEANRWIHFTRELRGSDLPDRIEHFQCFDPADLAAIRQAGSIASMQPCHLFQDRKIIESRWGSRAAHALAMNSIDEAGIPIVMGSDAPIESADPWLDIDAAVRRLDRDGEGNSFYPQQRVSFEKAFGWRTAAAAFANMLPSGWGTLEPGSVADLQIIGADDPSQVRCVADAKLIDVFSLGQWRLGDREDR